MRLYCASLLLPLLVPAAALAGPAPARPADVEVIGRLENLTYVSVGDDDGIGHGWITARLHISRVLRGRPTGRVIMIRYFAHTYWDDQVARRYRLRATAGGGYLACAPRGREGVQCR